MSHPTVIIDSSATSVTLINTYDVDPARQAELAALLAEETRTTISKAPGFMSVGIHASLDGKRVVNYAQWASKADFDAFIAAPATTERLKRFAALAQSVSPGLYRVDSIVAAS